jgi:GxxExxY protein
VRNLCDEGPISGGMFERKDAKAAKDAKELLRIEPSEEVNALSRLVIGAALEVHTHLGPGFVEHVYESALERELEARGIAFKRQCILPIHYKGDVVAEAKLDLLVGNLLVVELKSVEALKPIHNAQVLSYLRAGELELGLLINFNVMLLRDGIRRVVWTG